jgi:NAD-dependent malate dehydrogenase
MVDIKLNKTTAGVLAGLVAGAGLLYFVKNQKANATTSGTTVKSLVGDLLNEPKPTKTLRVCVTGAAGQIGYSLVPMICNGSVFGPDVKIQLRLLDIPNAIKVLEGVVLELQDCAYPLVEDIQFGDNPHEMFLGCDLVVFVGGFPRKQGMERKELLKINGSIFNAQGKALNEVAKKTVRCLVVANPANTNCLILQRHAPTIPKENFSCLTRLDQNRAIAQIALKTKVPVTDVNNVIIWGNHSATQYPDVNNATVQGKPVRSVVNDDAYLNIDFISKVQKRGAEIINVRGASSVFSAANAVRDHLRDWYHGTKPGTYVSMGVISDGSYGVPEGLVFSYPVTTENFTYKIVKDLPLDPFSTEKIRLTTQELVEERNETLEIEASLN